MRLTEPQEPPCKRQRTCRGVRIERIMQAVEGLQASSPEMQSACRASADQLAQQAVEAWLAMQPEAADTDPLHV